MALARMLAVAGGGALLLAGCGSANPGERCRESGGVVDTAQCCASAGEFPNTCAEGACACGPGHQATVTVCQCPPSSCFDGIQCVPR